MLREDLTSHKVLMRQNFGKSRGHKEDEYDVARRLFGTSLCWCFR